MKTQFAKPTTALCLALSSFNLFVSGPAGHAAEPPLNPWLWVLHGEDPDWTNPPFEDSLAVLDTGGTVVFSVADFNVAQTVGGNRVVSVYPTEDAAVVCDFVGAKETVLNANESVIGLTVAPNGTIYFADYFGNRVGVVDRTTGRLSTLLSDLNAPQAIKAHGRDVYFVEAGTDGGQYHDGVLSVLHADTGKQEPIIGRLHYPKSIFVDAAGFVYVLEHGGSGTIFGGHDRLIRFAPGANQYEVVLPSLPRANAVVIAGDGSIIVGNFGQQIPGETGELVRYRPGSVAPEILLAGLPAVQDLAIDPGDNLYVAGFGEDPGSVGIGLVPQGGKRFIPLAKRIQVWCLALDSTRNLYFATGRNGDSIRALSLCSAPPAFARAFWRPNEGFELVVEGPVATTLRVQASSDLRSWSDLFTFSNLQRTTYYLDGQAGDVARRFYRVLTLEQ